MRINEIFFSIQGEGIYTGVPTAFVRLQGCNLRCKWCDTPYGQDAFSGEDITPEYVRREVVRIADKADWVCITGGEPLFQRDEVGTLVTLLREREYKVEIETNGSFPLPLWSAIVDSWCVDMKCPSSGMQDKNLEVWFSTRSQDQIKFVVADEADLTFVASMLDKHKDTKVTILISPVLNLLTMSPSGKKDYLIPGAWLQRCVEYVKEKNLRLSLQIHKFIYPPNQRGV